MTSITSAGPWGKAEDLNIESMKNLMTPEIKNNFPHLNPLTPNGKIWVGGHPNDPVKLINELGIRTFVSLNDMRYRDLATHTFMEKKVEYSLIHFPIRDFGTSNDEDLLNFLVDTISQLKAGVMLPMYIHCLAGLGRTGTIASLILSYLYNIDADQAMQHVDEFKNLRGSPFGTSPETENQMEQVRKLAPILKERLDKMDLEATPQRERANQEDEDTHVGCCGPCVIM